ncbi:MAG: hypothetical protein Q7S76_01655, partial [bacterium]|nr:hypothetical protein [bacterium]
YTRSTPLTFSSRAATYEVFLQKQPGMAASSYHGVITYPLSWEAQQITDDRVGRPRQLIGEGSFLAKEGKLEYNTLLETDSLMRIRFTKS